MLESGKFFNKSFSDWKLGTDIGKETLQKKSHRNNNTSRTTMSLYEDILKYFF